MQAGTITEGDGHRQWHSFSATANRTYIIEVKHPLTFTEIDERGVGGDAQQAPGYLADPSIIEIQDNGGTQVLGENAYGGFHLNFARAFFTPDQSGTYTIVVGAGPQDREGLGCYTITVRADDHADDFMTNPDVGIRPGESITATINYDVAPSDAGLNPWDWKIRPPLRPGLEGDDVLRPRRGIASLDDRDVFRIEIADAGEYQLSVTEAPTGVGVWYIWDHTGNLVAEAETAPEALTTLRLEPGTYYAEIGTPYASDGNTGPYTFAVAEAEAAGDG